MEAASASDKGGAHATAVWTSFCHLWSETVSAGGSWALPGLEVPWGWEPGTGWGH